MKTQTANPVPEDTDVKGAETTAGANVGAALIRSEVSRAAAVLFPLWPLDSYIAVNPLGNLTGDPFEAAGRTAAGALGARWLPTEAYFAAARGRGRIDEEDIAAAVLRAASEGRHLGRDADAPGAAEAPARTEADPGSEDPVVHEVAKWCAAFMDEGQSAWSMPGRELGLFRAWKALAELDRGSRRLGAGDLRERARALPEAPEEAIQVLLAEMGVGPGDREAAFRALLARCPGWGCAIRWRSERGNPEHRADLVDLTALIAFYVAALEGELDVKSEAASEEGDLLMLEAFEWHLRDRLLEQVGTSDARRPSTRPDAQAVFCIDVRSEGIRRHLEAAGNYETLGFAGFFGLAVSHRCLGSAHDTPQCPVLLEPAAQTTESPLPGSESAADRSLSRLRTEAAGIETFHRTKNDLSSKFALAELSGWLFGPLAAARTLAPGKLPDPVAAPATEMVVERPTREQAESEAARLEREELRRLAGISLGRRRRRIGDVDLEELRKALIAEQEPPAPPRGVSARRWRLFVTEARRMIDASAHRSLVEDIGSIGMTGAAQLDWAEVSLRMMGLTEGFGRLVLLAGHGSSNVNNPYGSALDCGACGGHHGAPNARIAATILNTTEVRDGLVERGIEIPEDTVFIAGMHDTTTDVVEIFDEDLVPVTHRSDLLHLRGDLTHAGRGLAAERSSRLPARGLGNPRARANDWAQVRPEWGLARNAAFIVGPRELTEGVDLECRTFLHSYRAEADPGGRGLETILTAPLVVAEWINLQYYFSTVDPEKFGSGDKTIHNVVGLHGIQTGPGGDLRVGLPRQSVFAGDEPYHEPVRLLAIVEAPLETIAEIIGRNPILVEMLGGGWVAMCARSGPGERWQRLRRDLEWETWKPAAELLRDGENGGKR